MRRLITSISDPKKVTALALLAYAICAGIAVALMLQESNAITRWFTPSVLLFGSLVSICASWRGKKRLELAALWPVGLGLVSGLLIEFEDLMTFQDHAITYIAGLSMLSLILVLIRTDFLVNHLNS